MSDPPEIRFLSVQQVLFLHMRIIDETGGAHGVRDIGLLEAAVARPQATWESHDLYPGLFDKAAALMHSLIESHPMVDGNKRIGIAAAVIFLERNGYRVIASNAELERFTQRVAEGNVSAREIAEWLSANSVPL